MSDTEEIQAKVITARDQLQDTLDEIGNRLNVQKRAKKSYRENPTAWKVRRGHRRGGSRRAHHLGGSEALTPLPPPRFGFSQRGEGG